MIASATVAETRGTVLSDPAERVGALFDAHHQRLYRLARRMSSNSEDAKDLVQETFLRVAKAPSSVPSGNTSEEAWLVRILVNICRDRWRHAAIRRRLDPIGAAEATLAIPSPEGALVARSVVWSALENLAPRRRAIVIMYELEGLAHSAIAAQLGLAVVTVRWHLARGRRELATILRGSQGVGR